MSHADGKGVSLAKGPVAIVGLVLLVFGVTALIFGGHGFDTAAVDGTVNGEKWLGFETNGWSSLLCAGCGLVLLLAAPLHWGAKAVSLIVGLVLGAAAVIALIDGDDVFGIFAANGLTKLAWGAAAGVLVLVALLPRVGGSRRSDHGHGRRRTAADEPRFAREVPLEVATRDGEGDVGARRMHRRP